MDYILLAKPGRGQESKWTQLLIFVVIFGGYAIKMFFKAKSELTGNKDNKPDSRAASKRPDSARRSASPGDSGYKSLQQLHAERRAQISRRQSAVTAKDPRQQYQPKPQPSQRPVQPKPIVAKPAPVHQPPRVTPAVHDPYKLDTDKPRVEQKFQARKPLSKLAQRPGLSSIKAKTQTSKRRQSLTNEPDRIESDVSGSEISDIRQVFSDPGDIRKAIIYQEILSKPLSLR